MFSKFFTFSLSAFIALVFMGTASICLAQGDTWTTKTDMPTARYGLSTSIVNDTIYAIGGSNGQNQPALTTVEVYDPLTDTWSTKEPMPTERFLLSTSAVNGIIYVIGGSPFEPSGAPPLPTAIVEAYDPATNTWTTKEPMPTPRWGLSTSVVNDTIYAIGGSDLSVTPFSTVEAYDPATNTWITKAPMPSPRWGLSTIVVNGKIYAFGGQSAFMAFKTFEVYDPATDTWSTMPDMPNIRTWMGTSVVNSIVYLIGGQGANELIVDLVEAYDPATQIWTLGANMPTARWALSTSAVNERIYAIGGNTTGWVPSSKVEEYTPPDPVGVEDPLSVPTDFLLLQNYPNPFNPTTKIKYQIAELSFVTLKVYDVLGREVATLINEEKPAGAYSLEFDATNFPSGVYFYQINAGTFVETKKMILLK